MKYFWLVLALGVTLSGCAINRGTVSTTAAPELTCVISDKTDEFTKIRTIYSGPYRIYSENLDLTRSTLAGFEYNPRDGTTTTQLFLSVFARWEDGVRQLGLSKRIWRVGDYLDFVARSSGDPDPKLSFLLSNDEAIDVQLALASRETLGDGGWVSQMVVGSVSDSIWYQLKTFPPTKMRIRYRGPEISILTEDFAIDAALQDRIPFALKCIDDLGLP